MVGILIILVLVLLNGSIGCIIFLVHIFYRGRLLQQRRDKQHRYKQRESTKNKARNLRIHTSTLFLKIGSFSIDFTIMSCN
ncbi:MAG TPA: hypothetical protein DCY75_09145, partial [Clostridiales bacterium]|nr:hypothetical protein [Clostridiales bacterium]